MSDTTDLRKAITSLYIAVDKTVADDVKVRAEAVISEIKRLRAIITRSVKSTRLSERNGYPGVWLPYAEFKALAKEVSDE